MQNLVVEINHDGISGYGEATHNPYYENTEIEKMATKLESLRFEIEKELPENPKSFWQKMQPLLIDFPFALCALDVAIHDWFARKAGMPLYQFWGLNLKNIPKTSFTLGIDTPENMIQRMEEMPWDCYKIKLGTQNDIQLVTTLREHTKAKFRVDANCAWTAAETIEKSHQLKELGVEFIEQPLPAEAVEDMKVLKEKSALPIIADESCKNLADVESCAMQFHGINIKLMKCGGITPALKMIAKGRELGLQVMAGCMTESSIGISNLCQLAPLLDAIDADGAMLLKNDIAKGVSFRNGTIVFSEKPGSGTKLIL